VFFLIDFLLKIIIERMFPIRPNERSKGVNTFFKNSDVFNSDILDEEKIKVL